MQQYQPVMRKQLEEKWAQLDPHTGETATVHIILKEDGQLQDLKLGGVGSQDAQQIAAYAVTQAAPFQPLEAPQVNLLVIATFHSKKAHPKVDPTVASKVLLGLAVAALVGFSIYASIKYARANNNNNSGYLNNATTISNTGSGNIGDDLVYVHPYQKRDGTWVQGHYRTRGDDTMYDNFSSQGNYNPFTGRRGYTVPTH